MAQTELFRLMSQRRYFHTFDALRFMAVFLVFLTHSPLSSIPFIQYFKKSGGIGVQFFFVLSGFLITYIILYEKKTKGKLSFRKFFMRRILRIWPLFYAMIAVAFLTPHLLDLLDWSYSNEGYEPNWLISCLFLENYKMMFSGELPNVSPLTVMWSLCIEEHFYLLWGIVFYFMPIRRVPQLILLSIIATNLFRIYYHSIDLLTADLFTNLDYFAFGAIPAYCVIKEDDFIEKIADWPGMVKYLVALLTASYIFLSPNLDYTFQKLIDPWIFGGLFMMIIFFTLPKQNRFFISDNNLISRGGIYTYGIYLYHTIVINALLQLFKHLQWDSRGLVFFLLSLFASILVSVLSYRFFEKPFLKLKRFFY